MRYHDWEKRLGEYIVANQFRPFIWGDFDCALCACGAFEAMIGIDLAKDFRRKYSDAVGAVRAMKEFAGGGLEEVAVRITGENHLEEIPVLMAQRGDAVLFASAHVNSLGFVGLDGWMVLSAGENGLEGVPLSQGKRAWRIA